MSQRPPGRVPACSIYFEYIQLFLCLFFLVFFCVVLDVAIHDCIIIIILAELWVFCSSQEIVSKMTYNAQLSHHEFCYRQNLRVCTEDDISLTSCTT